ncbi:hypothetical protein C7446_2092, partial [Kushneria sinocarnis]
HRVARSGGDRVARFYPADGDQAAAAGFMQRFLNQVNALFTDRDPPAAIRRLMREEGIALHITPAPSSGGPAADS